MTDEASQNCSVKEGLESGFKRYWRPIAAYVYLIICLFDFVGAPIFVSIHQGVINTQAFEEIRNLPEKDVQLAALEKLDLSKPGWQPLTLLGGGLFHVSFGAIIGIAAFTRGLEKKIALEK